MILQRGGCIRALGATRTRAQATSRSPTGPAPRVSFSCRHAHGNIAARQEQLLDGAPQMWYLPRRLVYQASTLGCARMIHADSSRDAAHGGSGDNTVTTTTSRLGAPARSVAVNVVYFTLGGRSAGVLRPALHQALHASERGRVMPRAQMAAAPAGPAPAPAPSSSALAAAPLPCFDKSI